jgi:(p)ppGpp synthase/HD superfamily hydrolase
MSSLGSLDRFEHALVYATHVHAAQRRKGSETPYVGHLLEVCGLVLAAGGDEDQAISALLHDAPEDQGGKERLDDIRARFGERVAVIVEACSDTLETPKPPWRTRKEAHIAHLHHADRGTLLVSLADKVSNVRAIVADYREQGEGLWGRFNPEADQRWYYRALADLFLERYPSQLATELDLAVADLERAMDARPAS